MPAKTDPRTERVGKSEIKEFRRAKAVADTRERFVYRRELGVRDVLPALGIGIAAGLVAFYLAGVFLQRTPLIESGRSRKTRALQKHGG